VLASGFLQAQDEWAGFRWLAEGERFSGGRGYVVAGFGQEEGLDAWCCEGQWGI